MAAPEVIRSLARRLPGVRSLVVQRDTLTRRLDKALEEREQLQRRLDDEGKQADEAIATRDVEIADLRVQLDRLGTLGKEAEAARDAVVAERDELQQHLANMQELAAGAEVARDAVVAERDELQQHLGNMQELAAGADVARDAVVAERDELQQHLANMQELAARAEVARDAVVAERDGLLGHLQQLQEIAEKAQAASEANTAERDRLYTHLTNALYKVEGVTAARTSAVLATLDEIREEGERIWGQRAPTATAGSALAVEPVFIVAQYKAGTSWLLSALSAHPDVIGAREIDVIRAAYRFERRTTSDAPVEHRLERLFGSSSWCRSEPLAALAEAEHAQPGPLEPNRPQGFEDLESDAALALFREALDGSDPQRLLDVFLATVASRGHASHLVLKGADQIRHFEELSKWQPSAKKIAITRDGRDATISAQHYKELMAAEGAPWLSGSSDFASLLENWASRAELIADLGRAGDLYVMRYEDLSKDFRGTFGALLEWLGLEHSNETIAAIDAETSFEARTGRPRGSKGTGVMRKGAVGEWRDTLDVQAKDLAWTLAGRQLSALGYTQDGSDAPLPADVARRREAHGVH